MGFDGNVCACATNGIPSSSAAQMDNINLPMALL